MPHLALLFQKYKLVFFFIVWTFVLAQCGQGLDPLTSSGGSSGGTFTYTTSSEHYVVGVAVSNSPDLSRSRSGTYTVSPELPKGLSIDPSTGIISGTPTHMMPIQTYTVTSTQEGTSDIAIGVRSNAIPQVDNDVWNMYLSSSGILYGGGDFTYVGDFIGGGMLLDPDTGKVAADNIFPFFNKTVSNVLEDPVVPGAYIVVGRFETVGNLNIPHVARIFSDGTIDTSLVLTGGSTVFINDATIAGTNLYVGGFFTSFGGAARQYVASVDLVNGTLNSFNPSANNQVFALLYTNGLLYVGGQFTTIGGAARTRVAAIDTGTSTANAFNLDVENSIFELRDDGTRLYATGSFDSFGGVARRGIAAFSTDGVFAAGFDAASNNSVYGIHFDGSSLYVGGFFTTIGGAARSRIARINTSNGNALAFNPSAQNRVSSIATIGSTIYVSGAFTSVAGSERYGFAALTTDGSLLPLDFGGAGDLIPVGNNLYVTTQIANRKFRANLFAMDLATREITDFNPGTDNRVQYITEQDGVLYFGGDFQTIGGVSRNRAAALLSDGTVTAWDPNVDNDVWNILPDGDVIYLAGTFQSIGGTARLRIGAVDTINGSLTAWNPGANASVISLATGNDVLYAAGLFTTIGGSVRGRLAALDTVSGSATAFNPDAESDVLRVRYRDGQIFAAGYFDTIGGIARQFLAVLDTGGNVVSPDYGLNARLFRMQIDSNTIYVAGDFTTIGGQARLNNGAVDISSGLATNWAPSLDDNAIALLVSNGVAYLGGQFDSYNNISRVGLVRVDTATGAEH